MSDCGKIRGTRGRASTRWYLGACKTKSSYRTIDIGDTLCNHFRDYKAWQEANKKEYGEYYAQQYLKDVVTETNRKLKQIMPMRDIEVEVPLDKADLVFVRENGDFSGSDTVRYSSKVINYELGIHFHFHAFRHTHATMLVEAGVEIKTISKRLGHGSVRTTIETYVHVTEAIKSDAVNKFETAGNLDADSNVINFSDIKRKADTIAK